MSEASKENLSGIWKPLMPEGVSFVGGHPIAGSDKTGIDTAAANLFTGARCILTPTEKTDKAP